MKLFLLISLAAIAAWPQTSDTVKKSPPAPIIHMTQCGNASIIFEVRKQTPEKPLPSQTLGKTSLLKLEGVKDAIATRDPESGWMSYDLILKDDYISRRPDDERQRSDRIDRLLKESVAVIAAAHRIPAKYDRSVWCVLEIWPIATLK